MKAKPLSKIIGSTIGNWKVLKLLNGLDINNRKLYKFKVKCLRCNTFHEKTLQQMKYTSVYCINCIPEEKKQAYEKKDRSWTPLKDPFLCHLAPPSVLLPRGE